MRIVPGYMYDLHYGIAMVCTHTVQLLKETSCSLHQVLGGFVGTGHYQVQALSCS